MSEIAARPLVCLIEGGIAARGAGPARALIKRSPVAPSAPAERARQTSRRCGRTCECAGWKACGPACASPEWRWPSRRGSSCAWAGD